ncbi:MAG: type II toxin-antitoxin system VapB family antitoxin [Nitrospinae bacterium]|nr:type II toxin-antitoxin system VapB family antitoxin [Nitrospinota bacterium]
MKTTLNISEDLISTAMILSGRKTKTETVAEALQEYIRVKKIEKLLEQEGKLRFDGLWETARHER